MINSKTLFSDLEQKFQSTEILRNFKWVRYYPGKILNYRLQPVTGNRDINIRLEVERAVGGGFAGQVYRVRMLDLDQNEHSDLDKGNIYALKIFTPPSTFSRIFRELIYRIGFQSPFQLRINPDAVRSGSIWHKFIRRAAKIEFGSEQAVVDVYGTLLDSDLGSYGELLEWVEGRTWRLEVDDRINCLGRSLRRPKDYSEYKGSPEFRQKYSFMHKFTRMLHDIGAHEFARQYEWTTMKSQPNCLKRTDRSSADSDGLVAVDFRAGLALLPFLPMSPGDLKLILNGIGRGSLVQFDLGDLRKLRKYVAAHKKEFDDLSPLLEELSVRDRNYRRSQIDLTHRPFISFRRWAEILKTNVRGWRIKNLIDRKSHDLLIRLNFLAFPFFLLSFIPLLGNLLLKIFCNGPWLRHILKMLVSPRYLNRSLKAIRYQNIHHWLDQDRIKPDKVERIEKKIFVFSWHLVCSILPAGLHRFLTDREYFKTRLHFIFIRPLKLYFNAALRKEWLREMLEDGKKKHMLSDEDASVIESQLDEPYIQKYLKSLAVHICTLPVTQIISVFIALMYVLSHPELPRTQAWGIGLGIIALFQVIPISPGSLTRGLYVLYLVIRERDFKNYNIAVFLSFFKYIGYLAFPIQMTYHYPALARFMAGHWATEAVHIIPVFGEKGALMEHWVFRLFYNWPLTIRRQIMSREQERATRPPRYWHYPLLVMFTVVILAGLENLWFGRTGIYPEIREIWWALIVFPGLLGILSTLAAGGLKLWKRVAWTTGSSILTGIGVVVALHFLGHEGSIWIRSIWYAFISAVIATISTLITELLWGENPEMKNGNV